MGEIKVLVIFALIILLGGNSQKIIQDNDNKKKRIDGTEMIQNDNTYIEASILNIPRLYWDC